MIYYVEDDRNIRELVIYTLQQSGLAAQGFADAVTFWAAMGRERAELVLLDLMLPGEDGITILKRLRGCPETEELPVILVTAKGAEYDLSLIHICPYIRVSRQGQRKAHTYAILWCCRKQPADHAVSAASPAHRASPQCVRKTAKSRAPRHIASHSPGPLEGA